jgi:cyanoexosortase A
VGKKKDALDFESGAGSTILGILLITLVLLKSFSLSGYDIFLRISPLISTLGLGLIASGFKGLKQYWQELLIVGFIAIPPGLILNFMNVAPVTAKFSHFLLWYLGIDVTRQGVHLILERSSLEVASGCTGVSAILQLFGLGMLVLLMFPTNFTQKIFVLIAATVVGFVVNGARVALMTYLLAYYGQKAFEYWHYGDGSLIFSMIAVAIFGLFCWFTVLRDEPNNSQT